ncbi:MAG: DEAD/DEAH box helicase, partial [Eubacteriales bacterium]|nr:DEAD/DEAH box helicase [Eubacteriales bacterium]
IPQNRQTLLFFATMPKEIMDLTKLYQKDPVLIKTVHKELTIPSIEQYYLEVRESSKTELLCRLIDAKNIKLGLVFCNTKRRVDELTSALQTRNYSAEALHGDMKQSERDRVMTKFRKGQIEILVATDVAARGIDVNNIEAVFNYDIPNDEEYYVHRIGRTGRAGKTGVSYSFIFGRDIYKLKDIQRYTKSEILPMNPPTISDVEEVKLDAAIQEVLKLLETSKGYTKYLSVIEKILTESDDTTTLDVAAALFQLAFDDLDNKNYEYSDLDEDYTRYKKEGMVRLFMSIGSMDNIQPKNIVQSIASKSSLSGKLIGEIDIHKNFTFVEVPAEFADDVMDSMRSFTHHGRKVQIERAAKRQGKKKSSQASRRR